MFKILFFFLSFTMYVVYTYPSNGSHSKRLNVKMENGFFKNLKWNTKFLLRSPTGLISKGRTLCNKKEYSDAIKFLDEAVRVFPYEGSLAARGMCYEKQGKLDLAIPDFEETLRLVHDKSFIRKRLIEAYMQTGKWQKAADELLEHDSINETLDFLKQFCSQKKYEPAMRAFRKLLIKEPQESYYRLRAECRIKMGDLGLAREDYEKAAEFDPSVTVANREEHGHVKFCQALFRFGMLEDALKEMPDLNENQLTVIDELYKQRKFKEAIPFYTMAIERFPKSKEYYHKRGKCYKEIGDFEKAVTDLQKAMNLESSCGSCCVDLIDAMVQARWYGDAKKVLRNNSGILSTTALSASDREKLKEAKENLYRVLEKAKLEMKD